MFSVLLSVYSKENPLYLKDALKSIYNQTVLPSEVVLVKDGFLTPSLDLVIEEFNKIHSNLKVISLTENKGLGFALNEGLKHCSYEWIARMDTDDICFPNRFEEQLKIIKKFPNVSFISSIIAEFQDSVDNIISHRNLPEIHENIYSYAKKRCPLNHPAVMYKKQAVIDSGGYREFPEDYHLWVRALMKGYKFYNIQKPLLYFRINLDTIRRRGGWKYAISEMKHQKEFLKMGFISYPEYMRNCFIRFCTRIIPVQVRQFFYLKILHRKSMSTYIIFYIFLLYSC